MTSSASACTSQCRQQLDGVGLVMPLSYHSIGANVFSPQQQQMQQQPLEVCTVKVHVPGSCIAVAVAQQMVLWQGVGWHLPCLRPRFVVLSDAHCEWHILPLLIHSMLLFQGVLVSECTEYH
jgi:hypothetical protein